MSTERPMVTASVNWPARKIREMGGGIIREELGVHIELTFPLHSHEIALENLDAAVRNIRAQVADTQP